MISLASGKACWTLSQISSLTSVLLCCYGNTNAIASSLTVLQINKIRTGSRKVWSNLLERSLVTSFMRMSRRRLTLSTFSGLSQLFSYSDCIIHDIMVRHVPYDCNQRFSLAIYSLSDYFSPSIACKKSASSCTLPNSAGFLGYCSFWSPRVSLVSKKAGKKSYPV